jgi:hypothetical protein
MWHLIELYHLSHRDDPVKVERLLVIAFKKIVAVSTRSFLGVDR